MTFSSRDFATKNPDLAKAFTDSIAEAAELAMSDEAEYVQAISDFSDMEVELVESLNLEYITAEMNPTSLPSSTRWPLNTVSWTNPPIWMH